MAGEEARVEISVHGEDTIFWIDPIVNGHPGNTPLHIESIAQGEAMRPEMLRLVRELYRKAYRDGFYSCQRIIKDALGVSR